MNEEPSKAPEETTHEREESGQPDALDEAFPPMSLMGFAPYGDDDDEDDEDDEDDDFDHHGFVLLEADDIDQARRTARAILAAMETIANQLTHAKEDKRGGQSKDAGRQLEQLAGALESVAELIEIYAGIIEPD